MDQRKGDEHTQDSKPGGSTADLLRALKQDILAAWETRARGRFPRVRNIDSLAIRDSLPEFIDKIIGSLSQTGEARLMREREREVSREHGKERARVAEYDLGQVIDEYRILRQVILESLRARGPVPDNDLDVIIDAVSHGVREAAAEFVSCRERDALESEHRFTLSEARYRLVVEGSRDHAIIGLDGEGRIVDWNTGAENLFGYSRDEIKGKSGSLIFTAEDLAQGVDRQEMEAARTKGRAEDQRWHVRKDGSRLFVTGIMNPLRTEEGRLFGYVKIVRDNTQQKLLEEKLKENQAAKEARRRTEAQLRLIIDNVPALIAYLNRDLIYQYVNSFYEKILGLREQDLIGKHPKEIFAESFGVAESSWEGALRGRTQKLYNQIRSKDGRVLFVRAHFIPDFDERREVRGIFLIAHDISEERQRADQIEAAKQAAESASAAKSSFLANMSHEIRTPMTAVLGFTELLRDSQLPEEERQDAISRIDSSGRSLLRVIDDILDISKIEAGKLALQESRFSPIGVASDVVAIMRLTAEQKGIGLRLKLDPSVPAVAYSDPARLRQILLNLIGNAVKFTSAGEVLLTIKAHPPSDLVFEVSDTGIGIAKDDQYKLFQPFAQADESITRTFGGTGLGLLLSRRLAEQLGGRLELVSSAPGKGSRFAVMIEAGPFEYSTTAPSAEPQVLQPRIARETGSAILKGVRVLLAEDVPDNQVLMRRYLVGAGAEVRIANDGAEAIEMAQSGRFDVILMDIQMPRLDGIQATVELRKRGYDVPILALTAHAMVEEVARSFEAGCDAHLTKPITKTALLDAVWDHANHASHKRG